MSNLSKINYIIERYYMNTSGVYKLQSTPLTAVRIYFIVDFSIFIIVIELTYSVFTYGKIPFAST